MKSFRKIFLVLLVAVLLTAVFPFANVSADVDKTALQSARDDVAAAIAAEATYWQASFTAFDDDLTALGGLAAVDAMIADPLAEQPAIDGLTDDLLNLLDNLIPDALHSQVVSKYWASRGAVLTAYTLRSRTDYLAAIDLIKVTLDGEPRIGVAGTNALSDDLDDALALLEPLADKTALNAAIADAAAIDGSAGTEYTPSSFALYQTAYDAFATAVLDGIVKTVNAVVADADASAAEADAALAAVNEAFALLVVRPDKSALVAAYDAAVVFDFSSYTPSSSALFTAGLVPILAVINDAEALAVDLTAADTDLAALYDLLVLRADKTALALINNTSIIAYYEERELYTTSSYAAFRAAVLAYGTYLAVNIVIADADASQADVDLVVATITNALALLVMRGDVDALVAAYEIAAALDLAPYAPASVEVYAAGLADAATVIADGDTDQTEADAALAALVALSAVLVPKADKTELASASAAGMAIRPTVYSNSSYQILSRFLVSAETMIDDDDASQEDVDALAAAIRTAIAALSLKVADIVIREGTGSVDVDDYVAVGDAAVSSYVVSNPEVLSIDLDGNVTGLKYGTATVTVLLTNGIIEELTFVVKAKIKTMTMVYAILIPVFATGGGFALLLWNEKTLLFLKRKRSIRKAAKP